MMMSHIILTIFHRCLRLLLSAECCVAGRVRVASDYYKISTCNTITTVRVLILLWVVASTLLGIGLTVGWYIVIVCPLRQF